VLPARAHVELTIMNMRGEKVRGLVNTRQSAGTYSVLWNGTLSDGRMAPTGIYIANMRIDSEDRTITDSIKMLMVK
jgi:flagellar hook assembly protein FlgD